MLDGGPGAAPAGPIHAWLVTDSKAELIRQIRQLAAGLGVEAEVRRFAAPDGLDGDPRVVQHTSHETCGYLIKAEGRRIVWAPEFWSFPRWGREG